MLVGKRMTKNPITVTKDMAVDKALQLMHKEKVRRFPVLDKKGNLIGMVAEKDLLYASPSPATTLSIYEVAYLLSKITVADVMATDVVTVGEDVPLEEAAAIMADNQIGALPVVRDGKLVGIITETDMFKIFLEVFGARDGGVRVAMLVPDRAGVLAEITQQIAALGANITALGSSAGEDASTKEITIRVAEIEKNVLVDAILGLNLGIEILDARVCTPVECEP
jgi:acetoin utilization protein AcuB